jgi:hypothetical protein
LPAKGNARRTTKQANPPHKSGLGEPFSRGRPRGIGTPGPNQAGLKPDRGQRRSLARGDVANREILYRLIE